MEWIDRLNEAMRFVESHLEEEISYADIAAKAGCSVYHFQRMFGYMAGVSLSEYLRRRRISRAAAALQSGEKVVDVALRYGYSSPTAFNRAFQAVQGFPPSQLQKAGTAAKTFPPIRFRVTVTGAQEMEYRIEHRDAFRIVGISAPLSSDMDGNFETVPALWGRAAQSGTLAALAALMDAQPHALLGVSACYGAQADAYRRGVSAGSAPEPETADAAGWRYYIAVPTTRPCPAGLEEAAVPAMTWAVFPGRGPNTAIQALEKRIVTEWLPTSGYEYANGPDVEVYLTPNPADAQFEVWIPVVRSGR